MYTAPWYRRLLPWIFFLIFLGVGPLIILYTIGYRYNTKKGQVERGGVFIVDSTPSGARIWMDGIDLKKTTPFTIQDISPGAHVLRLEKIGYRPWEKSLDIRAEQATFANTIWLWPEQEPTLLSTSTVLALKKDPTETRIAALVAHGKTLSLEYWDTEIPQGIPVPLPPAFKTPPEISWQQNGQALFLHGPYTGDPYAWSRWTTGTPTLEMLPAGLYHWTDAVLTGITPTSVLYLDPSMKTLASSPLSSTTRAQALLWQQEAMQPPPQPSHTQPKTMSLVVSDHEITLVTPDHDVNTIWRESSSLHGADWHRFDGTIFFANDQNIIALELDDRHGRQMTTLATFDRINAMVVLDEVLWVAGARDGREGVWEIKVQ